jgi:YfiH family protein
MANGSSDKSPGSVAADWPAPDCVHAFTTKRNGGVSKGIYDSFNLASHVGDLTPAVNSNRQLLKTFFELPAEPCWLNQVHSNRVIEAGHGPAEADASWTADKDTVCAVLTADCLPVFFTDKVGSRVGIAHAGWRGLLNGVISKTFSAMQMHPHDCLVWLGPSIGPDAFEVGGEVVLAFSEKDPATYRAFRQKDDRHWLCDMYQLARIELEQLGIKQVFGGGLCTCEDEASFYSFRRDGGTGRMASLIWVSG